MNHSFNGVADQKPESLGDQKPESLQEGLGDQKPDGWDGVLRYSLGCLSGNNAITQRLPQQELQSLRAPLGPDIASGLWDGVPLQANRHAWTSKIPIRMDPPAGYTLHFGILGHSFGHFGGPGAPNVQGLGNLCNSNKFSMPTCRLLCSSVLVTTSFLMSANNMLPIKELHRSL